MYIVLIGWMYVVTLMAFTETSLLSGLITWLFFGALPAAGVFWIARRSSGRPGKPK